MFLQTTVRVALFGIGLGVSGNWQQAVLDSYSLSCTMLPHPARYPNQLVLLSKGHFSIKGVKELFACDYEPLPGFEGMHRPRIILDSSK